MTKSEITSPLNNMSSTLFRFPSNADFPMTGERYVPGILGPIQLEHFHRYLFSLRFAKDCDLVDVASGEGYGSALLAQVARSVAGVDIDPEVVKHSNRRYGSQKLSFRVGNAIQLPCESDSLDLAVSFETIEHIVDHAAFLAELKRVLHSDGLLVISTPDKPVYRTTLTEENPFHVKELDGQQFRSLLASYFRNVKIFEQRSLHGSLIVSAEGVGNTEDMEFYYSENGSDFRRTEGNLNSPFLIALASDTELPYCPTSIMDSPAEIEKIRGDLGYSRGEMWRLQAQVPQLEAEATEMRNRIEELTKELDKARVRTELAKAETRYLRSRINNCRATGPS